MAALYRPRAPPPSPPFSWGIQELFMTAEEMARYTQADQAERKVSHESARARTMFSHGAFMSAGSSPEVGITGYKAADRRETDTQIQTGVIMRERWRKKAWRILQSIRGIKVGHSDDPVESEVQPRAFCQRDRMFLLPPTRALRWSTISST